MTHEIQKDPAPLIQHPAPECAADVLRPSTPLVVDAMSVFFAWEKLRLLYNAILFGQVMVYAVLFAKDWDLFFLIYAAPGVVGANVWLCAGPVMESYLCWAGYERRSVRWWIAALVTYIAMMLTYHYIESYVPVPFHDR